MSWKFNYLDELKKKRQVQQLFFQKGNYFHQLCHFYYQGVQTGMVPGSPQILEYMTDQIKEDSKDINLENVQVMYSVIKMITRYVNAQSPRIDKDVHKIIGVERPVEYVLETEYGPIVVEGYIDLPYEDKYGITTVRDHKTGQKGSWANYQLYTLPQLLIYACLLWLEGYTVRKVEINFINSYDYKKKEPTIQEAFQLYQVQITQEMIENFWEYIKEKATRVMYLRQNPKAIQPTYSKDCGKCDYQPICIANLKGQPTRGLIINGYDKVDRREFRRQSKAADAPWGNEEDSGGDSDLLGW